MKCSDKMGLSSGRIIFLLPKSNFKLIPVLLILFWIMAGFINSGENISGDDLVRENYFLKKRKKGKVWESLQRSSKIIKTSASDYFRSKQSGDWSVPETWESSSDNNNWQSATEVPTSLSHGITILSDYIVTVSAPISLDETTIDGTLQILSANSYSSTITIGPAASAINVSPGGKIEIGNGTATGTGYETFATSTANTWGDGSVFEWNNGAVFDASDNPQIVYFPNSSVGTTPVFRITSVSGSPGGSYDFVINGLLQVNTDLTLSGSGNKYFRDGICGSATMTYPAGGGTFYIGRNKEDYRSNAILGGADLNLIMNKNLNIAGGTILSVPADSVVRISSGNSSSISKGTDANFVVNGTADMTTINMSNNSGSVTINGYLKTEATGGLKGSGTSTVTGGTVNVNTGSTIEYNATTDQAITRSSTLSGTAPYYNIVFSGSGIKTPGSAVKVDAEGSVTITGTPVVDFSSQNLGLTTTNNTSFTMDGGRLKLGTGETLPLMEGAYNVTGGVVEYNGTGSQTIRSKSYQNIEVNGSNVSNSSGNITLNSNGTFIVKNGKSFTINNDAIVGNDGSQTVTIESGGVFNCGNPLGFYGALVGVNSPSVRNNIEAIVFEPGSTINYSRSLTNGAQIITNTVPYQNLVLSGTGIKTAPAGILEIQGNFVKSTACTFAHNNGTVLFNGTAQQNYSSASPQMEFYNLINNNITGVNVNDSLSVYRLLTLNADSKITLSKDITLRSDKNNTASIDKIGTGTITYNSGRFIVERYINTDIAANGGHSKSWQFIATPAHGETIHDTWQEGGSTTITGYGVWITDPYPSNGFDGTSYSPSMKSYDAASDNWVGISGTNIPLANEKGYMVFVRGDRQARGLADGPTPTVLRTRGRLYLPVSGSEPPVSAVAASQFQSIGNPYPSAIDFTKITKANIDNNFYVWDPSLYGNYGVGGYQTITGATGYVATPGGTDIYNSSMDYRYIQSGQAFFVHNTSGGGSVSFGESCKVADGNHLVNRGPVPAITTRQLLFTNLYSDDGIADGNAVAFDRQFSDNIDKDDALKINNSGENFALASHGKILSVEARQPLSFADTVFYDMHNLQKKDYTLVFAPRNMNNVAEAFLIDKYLQTEQHMSLVDSTHLHFSVNSDPGSAATNRFMLVFRAAAGPLSVSFISVDAVLKGNAVLINWKVADEENIQEYEIEHSADGVHFTFLSKVPAQNNGDNHYDFSDEGPYEGYNYYRIKSVEKSGKTQYSIIVKIFLKNEMPSFVVSSANHLTRVQFINQPAGKYHIALFNSVGQLMVAKEIHHDGGNNIYNLQLSKYYCEGIYHIEVIMPGGERKVMKVFND